jgi:medium-chain acyl-[acyl-carrier-protein] hydrolase
MVACHSCNPWQRIYVTLPYDKGFYLTNNMTKKSNVWFQSGPAHDQVDLKMFCFPYAGGSAVVFKKWTDFLPSTLQVIPVELPGRGARLQERPFLSLPALVEELAGVIGPLLDKPFVFYGHSMGAIIAFELARSLRRQYDREPQALFVGGRRAPQTPNNDPVTYHLPKEEFVEELMKLDGTPREVIEHEELMEMMIPLLRADFQLTQTYEYTADTPLRCPINVYGGLEDHHVPRDLLSPWKEQTRSNFALHMLPGDHFFLRSSQDLLLRLLARELREVIAHSQARIA